MSPIITHPSSTGWIAEQNVNSKIIIIVPHTLNIKENIGLSVYYAKIHEIFRLISTYGYLHLSFVHLHELYSSWLIAIHTQIIYLTVILRLA